MRVHISLYWLYSNPVKPEYYRAHSTRYLTCSLRQLVRYRVEHSKRNSISTLVHVLLSIYFMANTRSIKPTVVDQNVTIACLRVFPWLAYSCSRLSNSRVIVGGEQKSGRERKTRGRIYPRAWNRLFLGKLFTAIVVNFVRNVRTLDTNLALLPTLNPRGGEYSHMKMTGVLVGNFRKQP